MTYIILYSLFILFLCRVLFIMVNMCVNISHAEYAFGAFSNTLINTCNFNSSYTTTRTPATPLPATPTTTPSIPAVVPGICMCYDSHCSCIFRTHAYIMTYILQRGKYLFQPDPINTVDSTQFLSQLHHHLLTLLLCLTFRCSSRHYRGSCHSWSIVHMSANHNCSMCELLYFLWH